MERWTDKLRDGQTDLGWIEKIYLYRQTDGQTDAVR
jgi:hypothetical protein